MGCWVVDEDDFSKPFSGCSRCWNGNLRFSHYCPQPAFSRKPILLRLKSAKANFWQKSRTCFSGELVQASRIWQSMLCTCTWLQVNLEPPVVCLKSMQFLGNAKFSPLFQRAEHIEGTWWQIMNSFFYSWSHPGSPNRVFSVTPTAGLGSVKKQGCTRGTYNMLALHKMREWAVIPQFKSLISILSCLIGCRAFEQTLT